MDKKIIHKDLASGRWGEMSLIEQMANIGSEVNRAFNWKNKGRHEHSERAFFRALELIDLTVKGLKKYSKLKEVLRVRETLIDYFYGYHEYRSTEEAWRKYFNQFGYALRKDR